MNFAQAIMQMGPSLDTEAVTPDGFDMFFEKRDEGAYDEASEFLRAHIASMEGLDAESQIFEGNAPSFGTGRMFTGLGYNGSRPVPTETNNFGAIVMDNNEISDRMTDETQ
jgi:hypothetical protein